MLLIYVERLAGESQIKEFGMRENVSGGEIDK